MTPNLQAFLDMLAVSEGTSTSPITQDRGYDIIVSGVDGPERFDDYRAHPFADGRPSKVINSHGLTSNASGRYQFMLRDYFHYRALLHLADFGPDSQDAWAIQLIRERGALPDIDAGHFVIAVGKVSNLWASLPGQGNTYGQHINHIDDLCDAYERAGGQFA